MTHVNREAPGHVGRTHRPPGRRGLPLLLALGLLTAAAPSATRAQGQGSGADLPEGGSFDGLLRAMQLKAKPSTAPDFVRRSRPASTDYIPVGRPHRERSLKILTPAEVEAETNALDSARLRQQRRAGIKPAPVPLKAAKPVAGAPKTKDR